VAIDQPAAGDVLSSEELVKLAQSRMLNAIEATFVDKTHDETRADPASDVWTRGPEQSTEFHVLVDLRDMRFWSDKRTTPEIEPDSGSNRGRFQSSWNLKSNINYRMGPNAATIDTKPYGDRDVPRFNDFFFGALLYPPKPKGWGFNDGSLISLMREGTAHRDFEEVDGRRCVVVDCPVPAGVRARAWLDAERSLAPLRLQRFDPEEKSLMGEWEMKDLVEMSGGGQKIWLPTQVTFRGSGRTEFKVSVYTAARTAIKVNPAVSDASFAIELPPGTEVHDAVSNTTFVIPGTPEREKPPVLAPAWHWGVWANVIIIAVLGVLMFVRWRRRGAAIRAS
jgi:hypothetical protein